MLETRAMQIFTLLTALLLAVALTGCEDGGGSSRHATPAPPGADDSVVEELANALAGLTPSEVLDTSARALLLRDPDWMVELGMEDPDTPARLTDLSDSYRGVTAQMAAVILQAFDRFDATQLSETERLHFAIYGWYLEDLIAADNYRLYTYPISASLDSQERITRLFFTDVHPLESEEDASRYVARLRLVGERMDQIADELRTRRRAGIVAPRLTLEWALQEIEAIANQSAGQTVYYTALRARLQTLEPPLASADQLLESARQAINDELLPGYRNLAAYLRVLISAAPNGAGVGQYNGGRAYYAYLLGHHTTTQLSAEEIHQTGIDELARIHTEMAERFAALGYPADESLSTSFGRAAGDAGVVPANNVVTYFEQLIQETQSRLGEAFTTLPTQELIVIADPIGGFYVAGSLDGSRPAAFYATAASQPVYQLRSLTYHETVPGHHLQISLAQSLQLPPYSHLTHFTSYIEGWALYAERLAFDLGWFESDLYGDLGRLQWEALRASRLVVDTGLHHFGWSFDRAVVQMQNDTGFSRAFCEGQVARYVAMPGQATAYMIGMLKFVELRDRVATALGDRFDLSAFHDLVLGRGDMPLATLEAFVDAYLQSNGQ